MAKSRECQSNGVRLSLLCHYTGMAAASFVPSSSRPNPSHTVNISSLGTLGIGIVTLLVLGVAVLTCTVDRQLDVQKYQLSLAQSRMELAHLNRLATAGELAASIAHEINQPLAAIAMNASTALNWLDIDPPQLTGSAASNLKNPQTSQSSQRHYHGYSFHGRKVSSADGERQHERHHPRRSVSDRQRAC